MAYHQALSPSRAKDYLQCPLKFRFLVVDRRPQPPTIATVKGTLVHAVLEDLFTVPSDQRNLHTATDLVAPTWNTLSEKHPDYLQILSDAYPVTELFAESRALLENYFTLENPENLQPARREERVETQLDSGLHLRGIVDRVDMAPNGAMRVVDYKTGKAPSPRFVDEALFQMRFYALMLRQQAQLPRRMQLLYLKSKDVLTFDPDEAAINQFETELNQLWQRIAGDLDSGSFAPKKGPLCGWCDFQSDCPVFGGNPGESAATDLQRVRQMNPN